MSTRFEIPEHVRRAYDGAVIAINSLSNEAVELEKKFGQSSALVQKKIEQVTALRSFYKNNFDYIEYILKLSHIMAVNNIALEIMTMQKDVGLPFGECARILGYEFTKTQTDEIEKIDNLIAQVQKIHRKA